MNIEQLHSLFLTCKTANTDTRKISKGDMYFALKGENFDGNLFADEALNKGAKYAIIDDGKYNNLPETILVGNVLNALQELATFHRNHLGIPIIAITGSNGKTTTKELINAVLSKKYNAKATQGNLNNHIGVPLTLLSMDNHTEIGIVEMGANHKKEIAFLCSIAEPDYGYITNFGKAHLEGFGSVQGVIQGKCELYDYLIAHNKTIFINGHDEIQLEKTKRARTFSFGTSKNKFDVSIDPVAVQPYVRLRYNNTEIQSQLIGEYNVPNISAAIAIGNYFKVDEEAIKQGVENYLPQNNRSQIIEKGTHKIILDAYNANPTSMKAALMNFEKQQDKVKVAILGDMFELGNDAEKEHQYIVDLASTLLLDKVILIGENFHKTKVVSTKVMVFNTFEEFKTNFDMSQLEFTTILVKGSRGMALERILELIP